MDNRRLVLNSPTVIGEAIDGEVMVINLVSGTYYNLTGTAAVGMAAARRRIDLGRDRARLREACGVDTGVLARDLAVFVDSLVAEAIVRVADEGVAPRRLRPSPRRPTPALPSIATTTCARCWSWIRCTKSAISGGRTSPSAPNSPQ